MNKENVALLQRRQEFRQRLELDPSIVDLLRCKKCTINVLVVTDSFLYFSDENFGLSDFVEILEQTVHATAKFSISRAHRGDPGATRLNGADKNFVFTDAALAGVDVVMLFGAGRSAPKLDSNELKALATFMDSGGGVFATGDHDWLGRAMCGDLFRVRSMRKWYYPETACPLVGASDAPPFGEPAAPHGCTETRHDTNRPGHDGAFSFDDQSDDIPQKITPIYETVKYSIFGPIKEPHALLCGPDGVIDVLPDHPHEGECIVPWEVDRTFDYAGSSFIEYPLAADGSRPLPKVIARATMLPGAETATKPAIAGGTFGVISAYDGHRAGVGRVTCDATWHHFININLTGDEDVTPPNPKSTGFLATPDGELHLEKIKAYFRNIVLWLAPSTTQSCMRNRWIWNVTRQSAVLEDLQVTAMLKRKPDMRDLIQIGRVVSRFASVNVSRCQKLRWTLDLVIPELIKPFPEWVCVFDPTCQPGVTPPDGLATMLDPDKVLDAALGSAALAMFQEGSKLEKSSSREGPAPESLDKMVRNATRNMLGMLSADMTSRAKDLAEMGERLKQLQ